MLLSLENRRFMLKEEPQHRFGAKNRKILLADLLGECRKHPILSFHG